jgi:NADH dehydrogenase (ubiquinone) Fe-S protein 1
MLNIKINLASYQIDTTLYTLIQRCELLSIMIPRFCFHDKLSIAGNCRMCLVELKGSLKPIIACSTKVTPDLEIYTNSLMVRQAREHIIEFLLINHPLDCPICDQGGECDLQDQTLIYGSDKGRFRELKRSVSDKNFGPFVKTVMTRCIHCTKCVRFLEEYGDNASLGTLGRGGETEIGLYVDSILKSELSGNIIDLCPVGALTSKPYAFKARPWELISTESLDIFDSCVSNLLIQTRGNEILRILPRRNDLINESWITDNTRFGYDAFKLQRLLVPYVKSNKNRIIPTSWRKAILFFSFNFLQVLKHSTNAVDYFFILTGKTLDLHTSYMINEFCSFFGITNINNFHWYNPNLRTSYLLQDSLVDLEFGNLFFILGLDLKSELPILNLKLKKATHTTSPIHKKAMFFYVGTKVQYNYQTTHLGFSYQAFLSFLHGKSFFSEFFFNSKMFSFLKKTSSTFLDRVYFPRQFINTIVNNVCLYSGDINALELNTQGGRNSYLQDLKKNKPLFFYLFDFYEFGYKSNGAFFVFQGNHFEESVIEFDLFLPSLNFTEGGMNLFSNCEGMVQRTFPAVSGPGSALKPGNILYTLLKAVSYNLDIFFNGLKLLKHYNSMFSWHIPYIKKTNQSSSLNFFLSIMYSSIYKDSWVCNSTVLSITKDKVKKSPMLTFSATLKNRIRNGSTNFLEI